MSTIEVILYGHAFSTFTRTARLALAEKGLPYQLRDVDFLRGGGHSPEHLARHPFGKVPVLQHGDFALYETLAITEYIDKAFSGTALQPSDVRLRARMLQLIGITMSYIYPTMIGQVVVERIVKPMLGQSPDETTVEKGMRRLRTGLGVLEGFGERGSFLIGDSISLADLYLMPMWTFFLRTSEGKAVMPTLPRLQSWWNAVTTRPSFSTTEPPLA